MQAVLARVAMLDVFARVEMVVWVFLHGCKGILGSWLSRTAPTNGNRHFLCFCRMSVAVIWDWLAFRQLKMLNLSGRGMSEK